MKCFAKCRERVTLSDRYYNNHNYAVYYIDDAVPNSLSMEHSVGWGESFYSPSECVPLTVKVLKHTILIILGKERLL